MALTQVQTSRSAPGSGGPATPSPLHHLQTCRTALGSDRAVSSILGVSPSRVSRWRKGQAPDIENADKLAGLALVVEMLGRWLEPEAIEGWMAGAHAHLDGRSPAYLIGRGVIADVIGAIEAEKSGVFA